MKYYDPNTRKRPDFNSVWEKAISYGIKSCGQSYIRCECGIIIVNMQVGFDHWQQGHFDVYEEYKNDNKTSHDENVKDS